MNKRELGVFEVSSGKVRVSDPCYARDTWCAGEVKAKNGKWFAYIVLDPNEGRVAELIAYHVDGSIGDARKLDIALPYTALPFEVGVDSGSAGIFDDGLYPATKEEQGEYGEPHTFYGKCCELCCNGSDAGIVDGRGVVSSAGWGDGMYDGLVTMDKDEAVAIRIVFIGEEEESSSSWDEWGDGSSEEEDTSNDDLIVVPELPTAQVQVNALCCPAIPSYPDADKYNVVEAVPVGKHLVMKVEYPNCTACSYEGHKVMVFLNTTAVHALKWKRIDPHFRDPKLVSKTNDAPSPAARFPSSAEGWQDAIEYAHRKSK